ncbi:MAG: response regulator [Elusimicrobia bacterium]|nr:response regulator [Elusimicrobiota bacterium]
MDTGTVELLVVEDDPQDVDLIQQAMKAAMLTITLKAVPDGRQALAYLRREGPYSACRRPDAVLLDLNLPGPSGREILATIKQDAAIKEIPVLILTTSDAESDVATSYRLGANCYLTKPSHFTGYIQLVKQIEEFWFTIVRLPTWKP